MISAGRLDGGTANVSTVDTGPLAWLTPRGLARSWCRRAPSTQVLSHDSVSRRSAYPRLRGADGARNGYCTRALPLPPRARG